MWRYITLNLSGDRYCHDITEILLNVPLNTITLISATQSGWSHFVKKNRFVYKNWHFWKIARCLVILLLPLFIAIYYKFSLLLISEFCKFMIIIYIFFKRMIAMLLYWMYINVGTWDKFRAILDLGRRSRQ